MTNGERASQFTPGGTGLNYAWCKACGLHRRKHVAPNESCPPRADSHREYDEIYCADDAAHKGKAHGWIQWKGTDVCIDVYCACGEAGHVDGGFFYHYKCRACGARYAVGQNVALIPLRDDQRKDADFKTDTTES